MMKKKFICSFLMATVLTAAIGTVVSCKDSDEGWDKYVEGRLDENATLQEALQAQVDALQTMLGIVEGEEGTLSGVVDNLQKEIDANTSAIDEQSKTIDEQSKAIESNANAIQQNASDIQSNLALIKSNTNDIAANATQIAQNASDILATQGELATAYSMIEILNDAKEKIDEALNANGFEDMNAMAAEVVGIMTAYTDLSELVYTNAENIQNLSNSVSELSGKIVDFGTNLDILTSQVGDLSGELGNVSGKLDDVSSTVDEHTETLTGLLIDVAKANELAKADSIRIDEVNTTIDGLQESLDGVSSRLEEVESTVGSLSEDMTNVLNKLDDAEGNITDVIDRLDSIDESLEEIQGDLILIRQEAEANLQDAKNYAEGLIAELKGDDFTYNTIGEFQSAVDEKIAEYDEKMAGYDEKMAGYDETLTEQGETLASLKDRAATLEEKMSAVEEKIDALLELTSYLQDYLSKQVTSILIQGTHNPIFGSFSLPMNMNSNVLAAFYGLALDEVHFPTSRASYYCDAEQCLSVADLDMLGISGGDVNLDEGDILILDKDGNAGTLYVTVNPNTVDFTGLDFGLENSIEEESSVKLRKLEPSNHKLSFGYTRGEHNGFYEASAYVSGDVARSVSPNIDMNEFQEIASWITDYVKGGTLDVTTLMSTLYTQFTDICDAEAIYAKWTDEDGKEHRTYSQYSLAATAVNPLSYSFMIDDYETFPGMGRIEEIINNMFEKIEIPTFDFSQYHLDKLEHATTDGETVTFTATVKVSTKDLFEGQTVTVTDDSGNVIGTGTWDGNGDYLYIEIEITLSQDELYDQPIADINSVIDKVNDALDSINAVLEDLEKINDISGSLSDLQEQIISYIEELNSILCKMINSVNEALQPILLVNTTDGFLKLSQMRASPTVLSSGDDIALIPTSFSAEILAPAYKKMVGVTNVYTLDLGTSAQDGDSDCLSALNAVNGSDDLCQTLDGDTKSVSASNLKAGYIYEFVYTAVDYSGKVAAQKYYVRVNE